MNIAIQPILFFIAKVVLIEWAIELIRLLIFTAWNNTFPKDFFTSNKDRYFSFFNSDKNRYFSWFMAIFESLCVVTMLYLNYNVVIIIVFTLGTIFLVNTIGEWIIEKFHMSS